LVDVENMMLGNESEPDIPQDDHTIINELPQVTQPESDEGLPVNLENLQLGDLVNAEQITAVVSELDAQANEAQAQPIGEGQPEDPLAGQPIEIVAEGPPQPTADQAGNDNLNF
jgi:hypothetical protein